MNFRFSILLIAGTLLSSCDLIPIQPKISIDARMVGFQHPTSTNECSSCHEHSRPLSYTNSYINLSSADHFKAYDCNLCHQTREQSGNNWTPFNHKNFYNQIAGKNSNGTVIFNCNACHEQSRPALTAAGAAHPAAESCGKCHVYPDLKVNPRPGWLPAIISHTPTPTSCTACHSKDKPTAVLPNRYNGFDHSPTWGTECKTCHTANIGVNWTGGYFDHGPNGSIVRAKTCSPCHDERQHEAGQLCSRCHNPVYPTGGAGGAWDEP